MHLTSWLLLLGRVALSAPPNIVLVVTDDLDEKLKSVEKALPRTVALLGGNNGTTATNWYTPTPICCPARAQILSGRYFHNLWTEKVSDPGCMHVKTSDFFTSEKFFAPYFQNLGYTVGVFGKVLNNANPSTNPPGVDRWMANGGGNYYSPSFSVGWEQGKNVKFDNCTDVRADGACYSTSVIGNTSLAWIRDHLASGDGAADETKPFFAYIAVKAPHIQDGPGWPITLEAPWYNNTFSTTTTPAPRTPNWNATGSVVADHHWLIRQQPGMTEEQVQRSDALYAHRLNALLSVDDLVSDLVSTLNQLDVLDNTVIAFTSDHGFQLGQFGMPEGKWNAYEHDIRVPFFIRGPGVPRGGKFNWPASHVDIMPTLLGFAGLEKMPESMDGKSAADVIKACNGTRDGATAEDWRRYQLVEYLGQDVVRYGALEDSKNNTFRLLRVADPSAPEGNRNLMYAEFTDLTNRDFEQPASERELFDLDKDPWQLQNLVGKADPGLLSQLAEKAKELFECKGSTCN